jgi:hypothetical protein
MVPARADFVRAKEGAEFSGGWAEGRCISAETERGRRRVARSLLPVGEPARRRDRQGIGRKTPAF